MIRLDKLTRRERWIRFISDEFFHRDPLSFLGVSAGAKERGTTLLARIRERRAELQREHNQGEMT